MKKRIKYISIAILTIIAIIPFAFYRFDIPVETLKARYGRPPSQFMDLGGMSVHYRDEGKGVPIVLVHGTSSSLHTWDGWTKELVKKFRVIRMDLPAFGLTGPNASGDYTIKAYVEFLEEFLSKVGVPRFHLAGNSLGGEIAWNYALAHPRKVDRLILVDAAGYPVKKAPALFRMMKFGPVAFFARHITPEFVVVKNLREVYGDDSKINRELIDRYYSLTLREGNRGAFIARVRTPRTTENLSKLGRIASPTLVLWGEADLWIPVENGRKFARDIPGAKLVIYKGAGHVPMEEIPELSVRDALDFLK